MEKRRWYIGVAFLVMTLLSGCSPDMEELKEDVDRYWAETELNPYIENIEYKIGEKDGKYHQVEIYAELEDGFASLSKKNQYETLRNTIQYLMEESILPECGMVDCEYEHIIATSKENTYSMPFGSSMYDFTDLPMMINGDESVTEGELTQEEYTQPADTTPTVSEEEIYQYMKTAYDELTNYGENYVPEIHDPLVAEMASERFGITEDEANNLYIKMEMNQ